MNSISQPRTEEALWYGTSGPKESEIVLIGEAWGDIESQARQPFMGTSGTELTRILAEAGIDRSKILITNVVASRPPRNDLWRYFHDARRPEVTPSLPDDFRSIAAALGTAPSTADPTFIQDRATAFTKAAGVPTQLRNLFPSWYVRAEISRLHAQIQQFPRRLIIAVGNYSLWACSVHAGYSTGPEAEGRRVPSGIMDWRGSMCFSLPELGSIPLLPIIHPAAIMRNWNWRAVTVHDLKARVPLALNSDWRPKIPPVFWAPPLYEQAVVKLTNWIHRANGGEQFRLVCDIETSKKLITCIGFSDSVNFAMCIPFVGNAAFDNYWTHEQETALVDLMRRVLSHPNIKIVGQNFIYDTQYIQAYLAVNPNLSFDTMLAHHLLWPGTPKSLDYISSLYCHYHWYWKEDGKEWDGKGTINDLLLYNCMDCIRTFEAAESLASLVVNLKLEKQWRETMDRNGLALRMMNRGVRIDRQRRGRLGVELTETLSKIYADLEAIIPQSMVQTGKSKTRVPWYRSPSQQQYVFGELLGMKLPKHRKTGRTTLGKEALGDLPKKYPEFSGIFSRLELARSVAVFQSHFIQAPLDADDRIRCSFNVAGTETFRWSSSSNAFGGGTNLQNIPKGDED